MFEKQGGLKILENNHMEDKVGIWFMRGEPGDRSAWGPGEKATIWWT